MTYKFDILSGISGLQSLESQWRGLHASCHLWARFEVHRAYAGSLQDDSSLFWIHISEARETLAIIPAALSKRQTIVGKFRTVSLGVYSEMPLRDFPLAPHADPARLCDALRKALRALPARWDALLWSQMLRSSNAYTIASRFPGAVIREAGFSNYFDTTAPFAELSQRFSKSIRSNLRNARNKLAATNWRVTSGDADVDFDEFLAVEASGWKGAAGTRSAIANGEIYGFYRSLLAQKGDGFVPEVALLRVDGKVVAGEFSILVHGCRQGCKIGYDEAWAKFSPGQLLVEWALTEACKSDSTHRMSFITDSAWHYTWRPDREAVMSVLLFRNELLGPTYRVYLATRQAARQAKAIVAGWRRPAPASGASAKQK